ncbi:MAG: ParA family protein [Crocosphaera sp.]
MSKIIAIFNQAGGVAKSTLAMNLGYHLQNFGQKVALVDIDPQASLTLFCGLEPFNLKQTIYESLLLDRPLPIHSLDSMRCDLIPSNINLSGAEIELVSADLRDFRLRDTLESVQELYDFILIDCPPSLGILSYISLVAATHILVPIATQYKAWMGTELLLRTVKRVQARANKQLKLAGFVPILYAKSNSQDVRALQAITEYLGQVGHIFAPIPRATAFADSVEEHLPLALYQSRHPAVKPLKAIANYCLKNL